LRLQRASSVSPGDEGVLKNVIKVEAATPGYPPTLPAHLNLTIEYRGHQSDGDYLLGNHVSHIDAVFEKLNGSIGHPIKELGDLEIEFPA